jgi:hypothetical protein
MPHSKNMLIPDEGPRALFPLISDDGPDWRDLERRVADLEDRQRRQDQEAAAKTRLRQMGLVFPGDPR